MGRFWYAYNGIGDPFLSSSYNIVFIKPGCINGFNSCAIYAYGPPFLSSRMRNYIGYLMIEGVAQPSMPAGAKKYVYGKGNL